MQKPAKARQITKNHVNERFHQDYNQQHVWHKLDLPDLTAVQRHSPDFFAAYRHSEHILALAGQTPAQVHFAQPGLLLPPDFQLPKQLSLDRR